MTAAKRNTETVQNSDFLLVGEAAAELGVSEKTIRVWCGNGRLACDFTGGKHRRIPKTEIERIKGHVVRMYGPSAFKPSATDSHDYNPLKEYLDKKREMVDYIHDFQCRLGEFMTKVQDDNVNDFDDPLKPINIDDFSANLKGLVESRKFMEKHGC